MVSELDVNPKEAPSYNYEEYIKHLNTFLQKDWVREVNEVYEIKKQQKEKENKPAPNWYSLYNGPNNLRGLAKEVELETMYHLLYSTLSRHQHASRSFANIIPVPGLGIILPGIRDLKGLQDEIKWVMHIIRSTFQRIFKTFLPNLANSYSIWDKDIISDFIDNLGNTNVFGEQHTPVKG
ncbi:DUF5677 domain-containing protein [Bacillus sp. JJ1127]|uniref:DUF5677 domain-containing protein n=1 Tax=Bacillus sp. JJ1127 TaxID=3122952 RepID=UPI002FFE312F